MDLESISQRSISFRQAHSNFVIIRLTHARPAALADELHIILGGMPNFFHGEPVVFDFSQLNPIPERIDWVGLLSLWRRFKVQPIGVIHLPEQFIEGAKKVGLASLDAQQLNQTLSKPPSSSTAKSDNMATAKPSQETPSVAIAPSNAQIIERQVRTGQQVYAQNSDLILMAGMSAGAEIIADGNIHCYGPLRGRVIAGAQGNHQARIFTTYFSAELVSIAGTYKTFEQGIQEDVAGKPACAYLQKKDDGMKIVVHPLVIT